VLGAGFALALFVGGAGRAAAQLGDAEDVVASPAPSPDAFPAAAAPLDYPSGIMLPWHLEGIDPEEAATARNALQSAFQTLAAAWLQAPRSLTAYVGGKRTVTLNARRLADRYQVGQVQTPAPTALTLQPSWCSVMDRHVFFVTVSDTRQGTLLASRHVSLPRSRGKEMTRREATQLAAFLQARLPALARAALTEAATRAGQQPSDALHIGLSLGQEVTRRDEGSSLCLLQLLEEKLAPRYTIARALGGEELALVRDLLGQPHTLTRPTRGLVLSWTNLSKTKAQRTTLPTSFALKATLAETVFGQHIPLAHTSRTRLAVGPADTITMTIDPTLTKLLTGEQQSLVLADWPQVAKVYGAWVYLDRGRAWGLKMRDRMVAEVDGETVKGHVVRFFGPELGLVSPRGFPIREGAILYIRKGQRQARVGLEFHMDPRTFPTPYPMQPASKP